MHLGLALSRFFCARPHFTRDKLNKQQMYDLWHDFLAILLSV